MTTNETAPPPAIAMRGIHKRFGGVHANRAVDLVVRAGTVHGLIGENGAGKSTLMSILYGFHTADAGTIAVHGRPTPIPDSYAAIRAGIAMVHQHFMLVDTLTVLDNVMLGVEGGALLRQPRRAARARLAELAATYNLAVEPDALVGELPVGAQQRVEILKALHRGADILILDEPTGVLTPREADDLFRVLDTLRARGRTVLLVTHKLREILAITDRVSVMRAGALVAERKTQETSAVELGALMIGGGAPGAGRLPAGPRTIDDDDPFLRASAAPGTTVLVARGLSVHDSTGVERVRAIDLDVRAGEIVAIAGVSGNGQSALLEALAGMIPVRSGSIRIGNRDITRADVAARRSAGVTHVPEDRLRTGLLPRFAARESMLLGRHASLAFRGWGRTYLRHLLNWRAIQRSTASLMADYDVRPADPLLRTGLFSGGNQQKLVLARETHAVPDVLLVGQPTRGVDIGGIAAIHHRLLALRDAGCAILLVSVELDEVRALADRILVMCDGRIVGETTPGEADEGRLGLLMAGIAA